METTTSRRQNRSPRLSSRAFGALVALASVLASPTLGATTVKVDGYRVLLDGAPFVFKGVTYSPVPIGTAPGDGPPYGDYFVGNFANVWQSDIDLMRASGINAIRLYAGDPGANAGPNGGKWKPFLDSLWNGGNQPIYVMMTSFTLGDQIAGGTEAYQRYISEWRTLVASTVNHPAVIGYVIGNEIFGGGYVNDPKSTFWKNFGALVDAAHSSGMGAGKDPFLTTATNDNYVGNWNAIQNGERSGRLGHIDSWMINIYRGRHFGGAGNSVFSQYKAQMAAVGQVKPLILGEYGTPHSTRAVGTYGKPNVANPIDLDTISPSQMGPGKPFFDAIPQGEFLSTQWLTMKQNLLSGSDQVAVGGFIFGWVDEYWKGNNNSVQLGGPDGSFKGDAFAGGYYDEAWFGLTRALPQSTYGAGKPRINRSQTKGLAAVKSDFTASSHLGSELYVDSRPDLALRGGGKVRAKAARAALRGRVRSNDGIDRVIVRRSDREGKRTLRARPNGTFRYVAKNLTVGRTRFTFVAVDLDGDRDRERMVIIKR